MKKVFCLLGVLALAGTVAHARLIGTNPTGASADIWCSGGRLRGSTVVANTEDCIDSSGNFVPTTTANQTLGTSSLSWSNVYTTQLTGSITNTITLAPLNVYTTGQITNGLTGQSADLQEWKVNGSTVAKIGAAGALGLPQLKKAQIDALVPSFIGELVQVVDYGAFGASANSNFILCEATGTAVAQYGVVNSTRGVNMNGCGTGK